MPKLSIIVAVYGVEKYIKKCLDSIAVQLNEKVEVIIVNDCTKDFSLDICKSYAEKYTNIRIISHRMNRGISAVRNTGIIEAKGKYCWFIDGDDYILPGAVNKVLDTISAETADAFFWSHERYFEETNTFQTYTLPNAQIDISKSNNGETKLLCQIAENRFGVEVWNKIFSLDLIRKYQLVFPEKFNYGEDMVFLLDYMQYARRLVVVEEKIYCYILHSNSMMANSRNKSRLNELFDDALYIRGRMARNPRSFAISGLILTRGLLQSWDYDLYITIRNYPHQTKLRVLVMKLIQSPYTLIRFCTNRSAFVIFLGACMIYMAIRGNKAVYQFLRKVEYFVVKEDVSNY